MKRHNTHAGAAGERAYRLLSAALLAAALLLALWHLGRFAGQSARGLGYGGTLDGQEGTLLHEARLILRGEPLYQPLTPDRVVGAPYPPLHAYALAAVEALAGGGAPIFRPGRAISLLSTIGAALCLGLAVWRLSRSAPAGLLAPALFLATAPAQLWATRIKPDTLGLLFTGAGLLCAAAAVTPPAAAPPRRARAALVAAALFAAAFFSKQTQVAAPAAVGLALLLMPAPRGPADGAGPRAFLARRGPLLLFGLSYLAIVAGAWLLLDLASAGMFSFHVWGLHPPGWWALDRFIDYAGLLLPGWPLALLTVAYVGGRALLALAADGRARAPTAEGRPSVLALAYGLLGCGTLVGAGTVGSNHNHLLEPFFALTLCGCAAAGHMARAGGASRWAGLAPAAAAALLLAQSLSYVGRPAWYGGEFEPGEPRWQSFVELIRSQPGEVLSDDVGLLLLAGKEPRYDDPATMGPAAASGLWDQSGLLERVRSRRFDLVLLPFDATKERIDSYSRWSPEFIAALRENYRLLYRDQIFSYVPAQ